MSAFFFIDLDGNIRIDGPFTPEDANEILSLDTSKLKRGVWYAYIDGEVIIPDPKCPFCGCDRGAKLGQKAEGIKEG